MEAPVNQTFLWVFMWCQKKAIQDPVDPIHTKSIPKVRLETFDVN